MKLCVKQGKKIAKKFWKSPKLLKIEFYFVVFVQTSKIIVLLSKYKKVAMNETVQVCHTPLVKDCNLPGPVDCQTEYEAMCETR